MTKTPEYDEYDEGYVKDILLAAKLHPCMSWDEFMAFCRLDRNGGWQAEVDEAARRYFENG